GIQLRFSPGIRTYQNVGRTRSDVVPDGIASTQRSTSATTSDTDGLTNRTRLPTSEAAHRARRLPDRQRTVRAMDGRPARDRDEPRCRRDGGRRVGLIRDPLHAAEPRSRREPDADLLDQAVRVARERDRTESEEHRKQRLELVAEDRMGDDVPADER